MISRLFAYLCRFAPLKRLLWRRWYQFLADRYQLPEWQIMNYGYAPMSLPLDAADEPERYGIHLYHHVASAVPIEGCDVLEVGCGRGGGAAYVHRALRPATMTAVDFSANAIALCQQRYTCAGLTFQVADAEALPFPAESFDAVVNVESSHCYGSMEAFVREVQRVLKPGGYFLHADFRDGDKIGHWREQLLGSGLRIVQETDITPNVLAALDADHERKLALMRRILPPRLFGPFQDFAALKGSLVYEHFRTGGMRYFHFVLRKDEHSLTDPSP
ncbi:MAG: class I SAM-dependent methyltransferase [Chthoniobacteraceae bacterium]